MNDGKLHLVRRSLTHTVELNPVSFFSVRLPLGPYYHRLQFLGMLDSGVRVSLSTDAQRIVDYVPVTIRAVYPRLDSRTVRALSLEFDNRTGNFVRMSVVIRCSDIVWRSE